jgi:hypothetical protein
MVLKMIVWNIFVIYYAIALMISAPTSVLVLLSVCCVCLLWAEDENYIRPMWNLAAFN